MVNFAPAPLVEPIDRQGFPYGLFSVVPLRADGSPGPEDTDSTPDSDKWLNGVRWQPIGCTPASGIGEPDCEPGEDGGTSALGLPKTFTTPGFGEASAFTVYGAQECSPAGMPYERAQQYATAQLLSREEARAEQAFWTGDLGNTPNLQADATDLTGGGGALDPVTALALLENFIARTYGSLGVIHVTRGGAIALAQWDLIDAVSGRLVTKVGTPVIAGAGYPGTGPDGEEPAEGSEWAYASPAVAGWRSGVFTSSNRPGDLLDRSDNELSAIAERGYLLAYDDCGVGAVNFTLSSGGAA